MEVSNLITECYENPLDYCGGIDKIEKLMHESYYNKYKDLFDTLIANSYKERLDKCALIYVIIFMEEHGSKYKGIITNEELVFTNIIGGTIEESYQCSFGRDYFMKFVISNGDYVYCGFNRVWVVGVELKGLEFIPVVVQGIDVRGIYCYYPEMFNPFGIAIDVVKNRKASDTDKHVIGSLTSTGSGKGIIRQCWVLVVQSLYRLLRSDITGFVRMVEYTYKDKKIYIDNQLYDISKWGYVKFAEVIKITTFCGIFYGVKTSSESLPLYIFSPDFNICISCVEVVISPLHVITDSSIKRKFLLGDGYNEYD